MRASGTCHFWKNRNVLTGSSPHSHNERTPTALMPDFDETDAVAKLARRTAPPRIHGSNSARLGRWSVYRRWLRRRLVLGRQNYRRSCGRFTMASFVFQALRLDVRM